MKWRKKHIVYSLIGLMVLINSCTTKRPTLQLLASKELQYPSASAVEFYNNRLYVFGDDARKMLILSATYSIIDSVPIADAGSYRVNKADKHDIESAMITIEDGKPHLLGVGSMSAPNRWNVIGYDLRAGLIYQAHLFDSNKRFKGIESTNIEGSCVAEPYIVFSNRANLSHPVNHLLFWNKHDSISAKQILLPVTKKLAGVSGLYYVKEKDLLFFTASEEESLNAISDGAIGESYLGWIENFSKKMKADKLKPDAFKNLSEVDSTFNRQKIESVCVEAVNGNSMLLHLVADNDDGKSVIFKMSLTWD